MPAENSLAGNQLLVAILALQNQFATRQDLLSAALQSREQPDRSIADVLCEQNKLTQWHRELLESLAAEHLKKHQNNADECYATLTSVDWQQNLFQEMAKLRDELSRSHSSGSELTGTLPFDKPSAFAGSPPATGALTSPDWDFVTLAGGFTAAQPGTDALAWRGKSAARFVTLRRHAEGGLGRVSVALDQELNREVALKEIRPEYANDVTARSRFLIEAEITGGLEHPGIVPIYGCGNYQDGRPYYAMRFIRGETFRDGITAFFDRWRTPADASPQPGQKTKKHLTRIPATAYLSVDFRQLLGRFVAVSYAMAYAHARGVLHRDLKPANVMLGDFGETLVVDWGLAKATGIADMFENLSGTLQPPLAASTDSASEPTSMGSTLGTLGYMSPEQALGRIDLFGPGTDIYLLGATLYHLLTGQAPHEITNKSESLRRIQRNEFPAPRDRNPAIPRVLEAICQKAMAIQVSDRYQSARDLARDLEAYLADEPVQACPDRIVERVWRWTRRHRSWAISGVTSLALIAVIAVVAAFSIRAAQQRTEVQRQAAIARLRDAREAVDTWQTGASEVLRYYPGVQRARERLLTQAAASYDKFADQATGDDDLELERARAYLRRGDIERSLQKPAVALITYEQARELLAKMWARHPSRWEIALDLARTGSKRGLALADQGKVGEAVELLQAEVNQLEALKVPPPALRENYEVQATLLLNSGRLTLDQGLSAKAKLQLQRARELWTKLASENRVSSLVRRNLVATEILLGEISHEQGEVSKAAEFFAAAIQTLDRLVEEEPDQPALWQTRATARIYHAAACRSLGKVENELANYSAAIADYGELARAIPDDPQYRDAQVLTELDLAQLHWQLGRSNAAALLARPAHKHFEQRRLQQPDWREYQAQLAAAAAILGQIESDLGNQTAARDLLVQSKRELDLLVEQHADVPEYHERSAIAESQLAQILAKMNEGVLARKHFESAIAGLTRLASLNPDVPRYRFDLAHALQAAGNAEFSAGESVAANSYFERTSKLWKTMLAAQADTEHLCDAARFFSNCPVTEVRDTTLATQAATRAVAVAPASATCWLAQGIAQYRAGKLAEASDSLARARLLRQQPHVDDALFSALVQFGLNQHAVAKETLAEAEKLASENRPDNWELKRLLEEARALLATTAKSG